ncbi:MAG: Omp28 family outer membrane lipoprotein [Bacteroidales bacterium]|nr:Omp28 family outer membrane lipoprotein [Bacteroidales bacterium]
MKKITFILTIVVVAVIISSCDKVEGPYLQYDESVETTVEFPELDKNAVYKKILVEEFTGHRCTNCPDGHRTLATLSNLYGDTLVSVCIHAGTFAMPTGSFPADFRTQEGTELFNDFNIGATPRALFNQSLYNGTYGVEMANWGQAIEHFKQDPAIAAIQIINEYAAGILTVNTRTTFLTGHEDPVKLALYVIEDGIISPQIDGSTTVEEYEHSHVLRGSLNGTYGTFISDNGNVVADTGYTKSYQLACADKPWNISRCSVVAILMDATTKEVLQVEKLPFLNE